jgi:endonuclease/exonuclease/phosphatase family metal-dependent hydrolase
MTYNIRYDNPQDSINNWKYRKENLCKLIKEKNPDLLGVQEALVNQVKDMDSLLQDYETYGVGRDDGKDKGEYSAIFYKRSRFSFLEGGNFWLSEEPEIPGIPGWDAACTRIVTWIMVKDNLSNRILFHFNTHFDHVGKKARVKSARLLKHSIKSVTKGQTVIVTGDFNCTAESKPMKLLQKGRLQMKDSRSLTKNIKGPVFTYSTFFVSGSHDEIIDHIFVDKSLMVDDYEVSDQNVDGRYFSDHLPVTVKTRIAR